MAVLVLALASGLVSCGKRRSEFDYPRGTVPDMVGTVPTWAKWTLERIGYKVKFRERKPGCFYRFQILNTKVVAQFPASGTRAPEGSLVTLTITACPKEESSGGGKSRGGARASP